MTFAQDVKSPRRGMGSMMKGSGLEEVLEKAYGPNVVNHIISGKAFARVLRAHFLVEAALVNNAS